MATIIIRMAFFSLMDVTEDHHDMNFKMFDISQSAARFTFYNLFSTPKLTLACVLILALCTH